MKRWTVPGCLLFSFLSPYAQVPPNVGDAPPKLSYTQLLQAPEGTKADWPSLRGKVVVLEFWATWCGPCVAEIPILNKLADSLDSRKVQFISIDDEDPAKVQTFIQKNPVRGWVMIDTSGAIFKRYGVLARPTTIVVDTNGRVVSTVVRPEQLKREALLQLAEGKPVEIETKGDQEATANFNAVMAQVQQARVAEKGPLANALFKLAITPGDAGKTTIALPRGPGQIDVMNAPPNTLLAYALGIPETRLKLNGELPQRVYDLYLYAPSIGPGQLAPALDLAIQNACGVRIERHMSNENVYVLQPLDRSKPLPNLASTQSGSVAFYDKGGQFLQFVHAGANQIAETLEQALGRPVVNESGITQEFAAAFKLPSGNFEALRSALEKNTGLTLVPAKRPSQPLL